MPERNAPCPCGSGKKYKKCCGLKESVPLPRGPLAINRAVAYRGEIGRRRKAFCERYAVAKKEGIAEVETKLREEVAALGQAITCARGCGYCCQLYVFADLQECDCIVHYLYEHEDALKHFLSSYPIWKEKISAMGRTLPRIDKNQEAVLMGHATEGDRQVFSDDLVAYAAGQIPCPFLLDNACSIYEVRPYVCAGVISVSPPELCAPSNQNRDSSTLYKADFQPQNDMPYFVKTSCAINFGCMPELVYRILVYGYAFLSTIKGLEEIGGAAARDPEVRATLEMMGVVP